MGVVHDDTRQWLLGSCVKCIQTVFGLVKDSVRSYETVAEMRRLIFRAFQCEVELLILVAKCM